MQASFAICKCYVQTLKSLSLNANHGTAAVVKALYETELTALPRHQGH